MATAPLTARKVSRVLKDSGIPVGYRYSQTGYRNSDGLPIFEPGAQVTAMRRDRYSGEVPDDKVSVFLVAPDPRTQDEVVRYHEDLDTLLFKASTALYEAGIRHAVKRGHTIIATLDQEV